LAFPEAQVDATDISDAALEVAAVNVERYALENQIQLIQSDVFDGLNSAQEILIEGTKLQYDIIVSNPPYVNARDMAALTEEFRHEPPQALAAGHDGLDIVKRILKQAADFLVPQGILVVEVGNSYPELIAQYPQLPFVWPEFVKGGHGVFVLTKEQLKDL
jgi:ribosomal protein L3 glutamine methyltransferase